MPVNSLSAQFARIWLPNSAGTVAEWSDYAQSINAKIGNDPIDGTTFKTGGYAIAESFVKGALVASLEVKWIWGKPLIEYLRQIVGSVAGFPVVCANGNNAFPTYGDEVFIGTLTLLSIPITLAPGQTITFTTTFMPADGGAITPQLKIW
jgi:hypothetical protein